MKKPLCDVREAERVQCVQGVVHRCVMAHDEGPFVFTCTGTLHYKAQHSHPSILLLKTVSLRKQHVCDGCCPPRPELPMHPQLQFGYTDQVVHIAVQLVSENGAG